MILSFKALIAPLPFLWLGPQHRQRDRKKQAQHHK
jgi:hypothetical protein